MAKRVPRSMRTRKSLSELIEGRRSCADGELVKLATRLIIEEALEAESRDALGREYYEHGATEGQGWRNGVRTGRLKTAEGMVDYAAPQVTGRSIRNTKLLTASTQPPLPMLPLPNFPAVLGLDLIWAFVTSNREAA